MTSDFTENIYPTKEDLTENRSQIICTECNHQFKNRGALRMHTVKSHRRLNEPTDITLQNRLHRLTQHKRRFHCPDEECKKFYDSNRSLTQHFQKSHTLKAYECEKCGSKFALERDLRYHSKKFCIKSSLDSSTTKINKPTKKRVKQTTQNGTQTDTVFIKLVITQRPKMSTQQIQTEEYASSNYSMNPHSYYPSTSDFAGQSNMQYNSK